MLLQLLCDGVERLNKPFGLLINENTIVSPISGSRASIVPTVVPMTEFSSTTGKLTENCNWPLESRKVMLTGGSNSFTTSITKDSDN